MKKFLLRLIFLMLGLPLLARANAGTELAVIISRLQTYQANFVEQTYSDNHQLLQTSSGVVYIKRPGLFRWDVSRPNQQLVITDGKYLWVYDVSLQQVSKKPITHAANVNPAALLSGDPSDVLKHYTVTTQHVGGRTGYGLKPKDKQSPFTDISLQFIGNELVAIRVVNTLGQQSDFRFTHIKVNSNLSPQLFHFKVPRGVDVLNMQNP